MIFFRKPFVNFLTLLLPLASFAQEEYKYFPTYQKIIEKYFSIYSAANKTDTSVLRFERRPDGWHVTLSGYSASAVPYKDELFWSNSQRTFEVMAYKGTMDPSLNSEQLKTFENDWNRLNYNYCPFYGYVGWEEDVIAHYANVQNLPDSILYGLGRAYSSLATDLLCDNTGFSDPKKRFQLADTKNCLSPAQLETYRKLRHLAIATYEKVNLLNPGFETIVGKIKVKVANEYVTGFLELREYQNEAEAMKELKPGLYSDFYISAAKNYLSSCEKDAILFTYGDNDTYPLLYVQAMYGFRTDVLVVNVSLLQTDRYINSLREPVLEAKPLPVTLTPEKIKGRKREVIYIMENTKDYQELSDAIAFAGDDKNQDSSGNFKFSFIKGKNVKLKMAGGTLKWTLPFEYYFYRSDLAELDVIAHAKDRPVYFAISNSNSVLQGLNGYFRLDGIAFKLEAKKEVYPNFGLGHLNTPVMYDNLMNKFSWNGNDQILSQDKRLVSNYQVAFSWLAESLLAKGEKKKALDVVNKYFSLFSNNVYYYDMTAIPLIESYFRLGKFEEGSRIAETMLENIKTGKSNELDYGIYALPASPDNEVIDKLWLVAKAYNQDKLIEKINVMK